MSVPGKPNNFNVLQPKILNLIEKPPNWSLAFTQECSFQWKYYFFVLGQQ